MKRRKRKGASLVEFVLVVPVLIAVWAGLYKLNSLYAIKQEMAVSVRYGAWLNKKGVSGALLQQKVMEQITSLKLVKPQNCSILGLTQDIKPIYRDKEGVLTLRYLADNIPTPSPLVMEEKYSVGHDSWVTVPKKNKKLDTLKDKTNPTWQDIFF